jgi:hypothetical protein
MDLKSLQKLSKGTLKEILEADLSDAHLLMLCDQRPDLVDALDPQDHESMTQTREQSLRDNLAGLGFSDSEIEAALAG